MILSVSRVSVESYKPERLAGKKRRREYKLLGMGLLYMCPALIILGVFMFYPIIKTIYFSFFSVHAAGVTEKFVGFDQYISLLSSEEFLNSMWVTFRFVLYTVPASIIISLFLALLANEKLRGIGLFRVIFSSHLGISAAASSAILLFLFHPTLGTLNQLLGFFGISGIDWLTSPKWALFSISLATVWMGLSMNFILLLGGIQSISRELYESARIDGAGYWQSLFKITIPMLSPTLFFVTLINLIGAFQSFAQIDILTGGGPIDSTNVIVYSIYKEAFSYDEYGFASAQAIVLFVITLIVTILQFKIGERRVHYQ